MPLAVATAAFVASIAGPSAALGVRITPVAMTGDPAPGTSGSFTSVARGRVNDAGEVGVTGFVGTGFTTGVWRWDLSTGGPLRPVALPGETAPDAPAGVTLARAFVREMTASGRVGYQASFATGAGGVDSSNDRGLYVHDASTGSTLQVRDGDPAPGMAGHTLALDAIADFFPQWNADGELVFASAAIPSPIVFPFPGGAWKHDGTSLVPVVRSGDPAPGFPGSFGIPNLLDIADSGQVAFAASIGTSSYGIYEEDGAGGLFEVARTFGPAPGVAGGFFERIPGGGSFDLDPQGGLAFAAQMLAGLGGVTTATDWGIWVASGPGEITLRHRAGEPAPDTTPGAVFGSFDTPVRSGSGELAFIGSLEFGPGGVTHLTDGVVYGPDGAGELRLLAREGDPVPGLAGEVWANMLSVELNEHGEVLFGALVSGRHSLFFADADGGVHLLAREGDRVDLGGGDVRIFQTLVELDTSPDLRHTAVSALFGDGSSGLFLISIPEPGTAVLVAAGLAAVACVRRVRGRMQTPSCGIPSPSRNPE
ncbi:hypothetical protein MYXO_01711 [Myxococcaceae bacterium]|nr:hypothetical protein MYXO_01711 [Myxococcaceae bacterium]